MGNLEVDMAESVEAQLGGDGAQRGIGGVAVGAEVREKNVLEGFRGTFGNQPCGAEVGEMALAAADALLERPGARSLLQQVLVMVGFDDNGVAPPQFLPYQRGGHPEVGDNADPCARSMKPESDRFIGIVRNGKGFNINITDFKR